MGTGEWFYHNKRIIHDGCGGIISIDRMDIPDTLQSANEQIRVIGQCSQCRMQGTFTELHNLGGRGGTKIR
jgi:hypothetical protein